MAGPGRRVSPPPNPPTLPESPTGSVAQAPRPSRRPGDGRVAWLFLAPYLVLFGAFVLAPIVLGLWMSLHSWDFTLPGKPFVGLDNYKDLLRAGLHHLRPVLELDAGDRHLHPLQRAAADRDPARGRPGDERSSFRGRNVFRAIYFAPYVLGVAVVGVMWRFLLDRNIGAINSYARTAGAAGRHRLAELDPGRVGRAGRGHRLVDARVQRGHLPRRAAGHPARALRGRQGGRRQAVGVVPATSPCPACVRCTMFVTLITIIASANMFGQSFMMTNGAPAQETRTAIF